MVSAVAADIFGRSVRYDPGCNGPVSDPRDKRALHLNTGAIAVDMESHVVATVGAAHGLPVAAIRVITDPAERALPASAVAAMRPNGTTNIGAMIGSALMRRREIPALFQTALDALAARATLVRGRRLLGPGLLLVNSLEGDPVTADEPYPGPATQTATMEGRLTAQGVAPHTLVEING